MTTGFQFAHMQWSGKSRSSKQHSTEGSHGTQRGKGWSAADILAEAARKKGHCYHVENPQPPTLIYGYPLSQVEEHAEYWAKHRGIKVTLKTGETVTRKMRSDAPILASGVISLPRDRIEEWPAFRDHSIKELKKKYGERLVSAVEHLDESHPHLHFYLVPKIDEDFGMVHPGYAASRAARKSDGNLIRTAYNDAMREWQDWIQETIGEPFGLARIGPRRARMKNAEWKADEKNRLAAAREKAAQEAEEQLAKKVADIERREALIKQKERELHEESVKQTQAYAGKFMDLVKQKSQVATLGKENEKRAGEITAILAGLEPEIRQAVIERNKALQEFAGEELTTEESTESTDRPT